MLESASNCIASIEFHIVTIIRVVLASLIVVANNVGVQACFSNIDETDKVRCECIHGTNNYQGQKKCESHGEVWSNSDLLVWIDV
jgi:hypothetical protein